MEKKSNYEIKICDPLDDGLSSLALIRVSGSDIDVVNAARVSYGKITTQIEDKDKKLIKYLIQHSHTSPFEHNQLSFRVKCPIFVSRQWMRHRMNSYNEISYRYAQAPEEFYVPRQWRAQDKINKQASATSFEREDLKDLYLRSITMSLDTYYLMIEQGVSRELARGVLPMCLYTQFIFTCNLHSLMHFIKLRWHEGAQLEIQQYAKNMFYMAYNYFPVTLQAWKELHMPNIIIEEKIPTLEKTLNL
jgi:thymidylate synthase (FAD)